MTSVQDVNTLFDEALKRVKGLQSDIDNLKQSFCGAPCTEPSTREPDILTKTSNSLLDHFTSKHMVLARALHRLEQMIQQVQDEITPANRLDAQKMAAALAPRPSHIPPAPSAQGGSIA